MLWQTRADSLAYLNNRHPSRLSVFEQTFALFDSCVDALESSNQPGPFAMVCAIAMLKAKNYAIGAYGLMLDGLGQEAGALIRPFIEYAEQLEYFRHHPDATEHALDGRLPKAGKIAMQIGSMYQPAREHFNLHASHSSYDPAALNHLFEPNTRKLKKTQRHVPVVLDRNMETLMAQILLMLRQAIYCVEIANPFEFSNLGDRYDRLKNRAVFVFNFRSP